MMINRDAELGWVGGMVDGEGTICFLSPTYPVIAVYNSDVRIPDKVQELLGTGNIYTKKGRTDKDTVYRNSKTWKDCVSWRLNKRAEIKETLELLLPFLYSKRQQALLVLEWIELAPYRKPGVSMPERCVIIREEVARLNKRGVLDIAA